ncbi:16S rRNA (cytidine(1402)-2'-O)-methyltransferase [Prochlorococcus marinus str. MU1402]|uniref:16S rRNA (cytidine(1402)-2'-O)-methyltransferase n=1 Tax=Prochlorococcus marinus TaxID=1219 RepID=UPI001ADD54A0|nr:16S rRNA (cytidine(1402)-2'-O)-methyltransferase [Prochlorococcus marinus]MBO8232343.1 16S rRNA (cytidine(1402)-2'-O)-methyltransferase [Prochlorococcus marinus XMU1402]MBW3057071.1 16S rRNA (cytidine(1402)-2'-O)-methyltransferase [Prochlorococcus marinus str. MU1402]
MNINSSSSHRSEEPESGVLYLVGTPIGNLNDISSRAINILRNVSLIACEDTRQTKKITNRFDINNRLISFNKNNSLNKIPKIINFLKEGKSVALVSDAGMPSICDPGENLVRNVKLHNLETICIPGPSAALTALLSSGFSASKFIFEGFLPKKKNERKKILSEISNNEKTTIIFESPHRFKKLLIELKEHCGGGREICVSRELTKKYEEQINNKVDKIIDIFNQREIIGEITIVIKGLEKSNIVEFNKSHLKKELQELINAGLSLSAASKYLAKKKNLTKNMIYNLY